MLSLFSNNSSNTKKNNKINNENNKLRNINNKYINKSNNYKFYNKYLNSNNLKNKFKEPIGLYDPLGKNINPLTGDEYQNYYSTILDRYEGGKLAGKLYYKTYKNLSYIWTNLPMYKHISTILDSIRNNHVTMIKAGTGVGKTVIVPKVALHAFNFKKKVICTVPKRKLAASNAEFSSQCLDVLMGEEVGYFVSGDRNMNDKTKLVFTTSGSLKSYITNADNLLSEYDCAIIDEVHERSIDIDFLILLMKEIIKKRPDFKLILMSATVDTKHFENYYLKDNKKLKFNTFEIDGKSFDVKIDYEPKQPQDWIPEAVNRTIKILKSKEEGDILIFMKAAGDGNKIKNLLESKLKDISEANPYIVLLESKTDKEEEKYAIDKFKYKNHPDSDPNNPFDRKIVIATNVAESSLTIDGVVFVIDNGYHMESSYNPYLDSRSLLEEPISKASATQRKGRAGRTKPGSCFRMYTEDAYEKFSDFTLPDIQKTDISTDLLDLLLLKYVKNVGDLKAYLNELIDPPKEIFLKASFLKLHTLGAITSNDDKATVTNLGKAISKFRKFEPNISKALIASAKLNCLYDVAHIVLISMSIDNQFKGLFLQYRPSSRNMSNSQIEKEKKELEKKQRQFHSPYGDFISILNLYKSLQDFMNKNSFVENNQLVKNNNKVINTRSMRNTENNKLAKGWCIRNGIRPNVFVQKNTKIHWDKIKKNTRDITKVIKNIATTKNFQNMNDVLIDNESNSISSNKNKKGGTLINNIKTNILEDKTHNIILAFCIGGVTNIAKLHDKKSMTYKTCFPFKNTLCKLDRDSSLTSKNATQYVVYNELFMLRKGQNILKLNLISKIPADVLKIMKKYYKNDIDKCDRKLEISNQKQKQKQKTFTKTVSKQKFIKKVKSPQKKKSSTSKK
jgi:HrpA-like RNA helicase